MHQPRLIWRATSSRIVGGEKREVTEIVSPTRWRVGQIAGFEQHGICDEPGRSVGGKKFGQTAGRVVRHLRRRNDAGADGIEMKVMAYLDERMTGGDQQRLVTTLKRPTGELAIGIETTNPRSLQSTHALAQIRFGQLDGEMKMRVHDDVGMDAPAEAHGGLAQCALERLRRALRIEECPTIVSAIDDVTGPALNANRGPPISALRAAR